MAFVVDKALIMIPRFASSAHDVSFGQIGHPLKGRRSTSRMRCAWCLLCAAQREGDAGKAPQNLATNTAWSLAIYAPNLTL